MTREEVYKIIDSERAYQSKWDRIRKEKGLKRRDEYNLVECWLVWMREYLNTAFTEATKDVDKTKALEAIRKVTALGVACMEYHDTPPREGS